jgi:hypothetical protein
MGRTLLGRALPGLVLAALLLLPFVGKPFTIDDPLFLLQAQEMIRHPLRSGTHEVVWNHDYPERFSTIQPSGPVMALLLVPAMLHGGSEPLGHAVVLALLWVALLATVSLAGRLGLSPGGAPRCGRALARRSPPSRSCG